MTKAPDIAVLIPSLHPDHLLTEYVDDLIAHGFQHILVVDDGSGPDYAPLFDQLKEKPGCLVIGYPVNGGKGHALKHGMAYIREQWPHLKGIVTADSDGQHTAEGLINVARALAEHPDRLILGSRDFDTDNVPRKSRMGNRLTSFFFALLYGKWLPDTQTGLRGFSMDLVPLMLSIAGERFEYEMNMLITCSSRHVPFHVVTIETVYIEENRRTHFRPFHDSARIYGQLFRNFFKYASASGLSTGIDVLLFAALDRWLLPLTGLDPASVLIGTLSWQVLLANGIARSCSAFFNFKVNKAFVFQVGRSKGAFPRYLLLAAMVYLVSSTLISSLNAWTGVDRTLIKIVVDTVLFFANYRLQRSWVFRDSAQERT